MMVVAPILLSLACVLDVPTTVTEVPHDSDVPVEQPDDTGDSAPDEEPSDPFERDDDGDGFSENEGDCDDDNAAIHPGQPDACNGLDDDCDGEDDEDASLDDIYEPNDEDWFYLGSLADDGNYSVSAYLHNDDDRDLFSFYADDPWYESFGFEVTLSSIPIDAVYRMQLGRVGDDGRLEDPQTTYGSGELSLHREGESFVDDAGTYGLLIDVVGGADCGRSYLLTVTKD